MEKDCKPDGLLKLILAMKQCMGVIKKDASEGRDQLLNEITNTTVAGMC